MCNNSVERGPPHLGHGVAHIEDDDHRLLRRQRRHCAARSEALCRCEASRVRIFPGTPLSNLLSRPTGLAAMLRARSAPHPPRCVRARSTMSAGAARVRYRYVAEQAISILVSGAALAHARGVVRRSRCWTWASTPSKSPTCGSASRSSSRSSRSSLGAWPTRPRRTSWRSVPFPPPPSSQLTPGRAEPRGAVDACRELRAGHRRCI